MKSPIFLSGLRKSGTSLIKDLFDGHPELFVFPPNEFHFFRYSHHKSITKDKLARIRSPEKLKNQLIDINFVTRMNNPERDSTKQDYREQVDVDQYQELARSRTAQSFPDVWKILYESMARACSHFDQSPDSVRFLSKTVLETEFFPKLKSWFPDLKFVYILRNPYGHFNSTRNSMREGVTKEGQSLSLFRNAYPYLLPEIARMKHSYYHMNKYRDLYPESFYVLVYDRLLEQPEQELEDVCEFLDIEFDECLRNPTICGELWGGNSWHEDSFDGISKKPLTHWKEHIYPLEIRLINECFEEIFDEWDFERIEANPSILWPFDISEWPLRYLSNRMLFFCHDYL